MPLLSAFFKYGKAKVSVAPIKVVLCFFRSIRVLFFYNYQRAAITQKRCYCSTQFVTTFFLAIFLHLIVRRWTGIIPCRYLHYKMIHHDTLWVYIPLHLHDWQPFLSQSWISCTRITRWTVLLLYKAPVVARRWLIKRIEIVERTVFLFQEADRLNNSQLLISFSFFDHPSKHKFISKTGAE